MTHRMTLTGTLTKVDWVNPHIVVFVNAKEGGADAAWKFESNPPAPKIARNTGTSSS